MKEKQRMRICALASALFLGAIIGCSMIPSQPSQALPIYARRYGVTCQTCHVIPPKLNKTGLAFQANHFNWPNNHPPAFHDGWSAMPISGLITNFTTSGQGQETLTAFQTLELFASGGINVTDTQKGGYWLDYFAATNDNQRASDLDAAFVSLPLAGDRGQWAVTAGQFPALTYQWDAVGNLTNAAPAAFDGFDNFAFDGAQPGVRLEYYNNRGKMTANGDYMEVGVPFDGHLTLNIDSNWYGRRGVYVHAFRRVGMDTGGVLLYENAKSRYGALIGTRQIRRDIYLMAAAASAHDATAGDERYLTGQVEYCPVPWAALAGRYETMSGVTSDSYPVGTLTIYPGKMYWLRISAETVQQKASRTNTVFAYVQF